jgi:hypothetical protein
MRQFIYILVAAYLLVGIGTGLVHYQQQDKLAGHKAARDQLAIEAAVAGLLWPFYILDVMARHDPRQVS